MVEKEGFEPPTDYLTNSGSTIELFFKGAIPRSRTSLGNPYVLHTKLSVYAVQFQLKRTSQVYRTCTIEGFDSV